ncbi:unnamed protein product, partial [marine sediment metagenome]
KNNTANTDTTVPNCILKILYSATGNVAKTIGHITL